MYELSAKNDRLTNVTNEGYTVSCTVTDNVGVAKVRFPTWKISDGSEGCEWYEGTRSGNTYTVTFRDGRAEGSYITHIYAWDDAGNYSTAGIPEIYIDQTAPVISDVQVSDIDSDGYTVTCTVTDSYAGVNRVQFPTWTLNDGQDDLPSDWWDGIRSKGTGNGNTFSYRVKRSEHNGEFGTYLTHIYAWDNVGNRSMCGVQTVDVVEETVQPTVSPSVVTMIPPTVSPSAATVTPPTVSPSAATVTPPTVSPSVATMIPPTVSPSAVPTIQPDAKFTAAPSTQPGNQPSASPVIKSVSFATIQPDVEHIYVDWEKVSDGTGIEVQYAKNPDMKNAESRFWNGGTGGHVTDLESGTTYYLRIRAYEQINGVTQYSEWSKTEEVETMVPTLPAFDIVSATPNEDCIYLIWGEANDITGYQVQYADNVDMNGFHIIQWEKSDEYQGARLGNLEEETTYYLRTRVYKEVNGINQYSAWSEPRSITTISSEGDKSMPVVTITSIIPDVEYIQFYWQKVYGVSGFEIQYCTKPDKSDAESGYWTNGDVLGGRLTGTGKLLENTTYYFRIRTYKIENGIETYSVWSDWQSATTKSKTVITPTAAPMVTPRPVATARPTATPQSSVSVKKPGKITGVSVSNKKGYKLAVNWRWSVDASGFQVQYALNKKFTKGKRTIEAGEYASSKTFKVQKKKTYYVRVRAYKEQYGQIKYGAWSEVKSVKIKK